MNGDSISSGQSSPFGYIPIGLDIEIKESHQDSHSPPGSDAAFSYQSWVDEAWKVDNESQSTLGSTSENDILGMPDGSERSSFSLSEEPNWFDEAFDSFCNVSPLNYDDLSSGSKESIWKVESNNECRAPDCGGGTSSKSPDKSSEKAKNSCNTKQYDDRTPPDIVVTESQGDQGAQPSQSLLDIGGVIEQKTSLEQPGSMAKAFLENPIRLHFNDSGKLKFLVL